MTIKLQEYLQKNTKFDPRAAQIVCMRHGWGDFEKHTFAAIGKVFGLSGTRVRDGFVTHPPHHLFNKQGERRKENEN